jgi:Acyl-coenzyme A:6-aminopenicillanic acid acyl-transferase
MIALALVGVMVIVAWFIFRRSVAYDMPAGEVQGEIVEKPGAPGTPPMLVWGNSSLSWVGSVPVLRVTGDAHAIGAAHGRLLAPALAASVRAAAPSIENTVSYDGLFGHTTHGMRLAWRWRFVDDGMIEPDRRMVAGLVRGGAASGVDLGYDDLLRDQALLDVGAPSPRTGEAEQHSIARSLTVVAQQAQVSNRVWIGRTFALPGLDDGGELETPVIQIVHPEGRLAWASVGWPGMLGVVTGVNAAGLAVMVNPARTDDVRTTRTARPIAMLARSLLEQAKTLDEALKILESTPTLGAAAFVLVDGTTGKWLVVERTPSKAIVEKSPRLPAIGDVLTTHALRSDPQNDRATRMLATGARVDRAAKLARGSLGDVAAMAALLRDQRATDDSPRPPGHRGAIDDGRAAHVVILDPTTLELWVADPRANGRFRGFDLRHELQGAGDRPAPPAEIGPDPASDPDRLANLAAARADLREARDALDRNDKTRAAEACARARARVPNLPEAVELDAIVAQLRGDDARARSAFQSWLDAGPDDPQGEERARAMVAR